MKTIIPLIKILPVLILYISAEPVTAQRNTHSSSKRVVSIRTYEKNTVRNQHYISGRYRTQPIYRNPHYRYPRHYRVVSTLPVHHVRVVYRGLPYFYYAGVYYTTHSNGYVMVMPPVGFRITVLPVGYTRIVVGPSVVFYHSGVYYKEISTTASEGEKYEITKPPVGTVIREIHEEAEQVIIDGKVFYEYNDILYKKISTYDGNTAFEVVDIEKES